MRVTTGTKRLTGGTTIERSFQRFMKVTTKVEKPCIGITSKTNTLGNMRVITGIMRTIGGTTIDRLCLKYIRATISKGKMTIGLMLKIKFQHS
jgi:hypothetical protein